MSEVQNDKKVAEKRKDALKDVEVSLRDQIPQKLAEKLDEMKVGPKVETLWVMACNNRSEWLKRQEEYLNTWDEFLESTAEGPFVGSSTLHLPMPLIVTKAFHARFMQAVFMAEPYFAAKPRRADAVEKTQNVQDTMAYALKDWMNCYEGCEEALDDWLWTWITAGSGLLKLRWDTKYTRFVDVVPVPRQTVRYEVDPETGTEIATPVTIMEEKEQKVTKKVFEGPHMEAKNIEDVVIIGGEGNPQRADAVIDRYWETASGLWTLADQKIFREDVVREVIAGGPDSKGAAQGSEIDHAKKAHASQSMQDTEIDLDRYEILEAYLSLDVDGSGINSDVVVWVHKRTRKIFRATYLQRINKSGKRPYGKIDFHRRKGEEMGVGLIEMMYPLIKELDAMHNISVDYGLFSTMPFGFYKPTTSMEKEEIDITPGVLIPLDNPQTDVYFPNIGNKAPFTQQQEISIMQWIQRLTGFSDLNFGVLSGDQGATRTATGARVFASESNTNLDIFLRRLNRGWKFVLDYLLHMLQQRIPPGMSFRVTGETGEDYWVQIRNRDDIAGDFDFELVPNTAASNRILQQDIALQVYNFTQNPILIQTGVVSVSNIYEAAKNYLKSLGVRDFSKYCSKPPTHSIQMTPVEEANRILRGSEVPVLPDMDHEGFLKYFQEIMDNDEILGQFDEQATIRLAAQASKHQQMAEALRAAQAQVQNARQAGINEQNNRLSASAGTTEGNPAEAAPAE